MTHAFENLLVSSPNGGGLLFIHHGQVFRLDDINTTGISLSDGKFLRGLQPEGLVFYQGNRTTQDLGTPIHDIHDVLIAAPALYAVGTTANEIVQLDMNAAEVRSWRFPGEDDARHINCLTQWNQHIVFCAFGDFTTHRQYKGQTAQAGFVQDLHTGERLIEGLSQPHSLIAFGDNLLLANSETRELREYDISGSLLRSKTLDGYTRGICIQGSTLYIGLSRSRNIDSSAIVNANLVALDAQSWQETGRIELPVSEIYTVLAVDEPDALPALLAGISQRAATDYRQSINSRDAQIQELAEKAERFKLMSGSLEEHLDTRNKQFTEHVEALTERDARIAELLQANALLIQKLERYDALHAEDQLKLAQNASSIKLLEDALQEQSRQSAALQEQSNDVSRQLLDAVVQIQAQEQRTQSLVAEATDRENFVAELKAKHDVTQQQLDQITERSMVKKQQLSQLSDVLQEKNDQLDAARALLIDVTQQKDEQLEAARALLIDVTQQKDEQLEAARALLIDVTQQKDEQLEAARTLLIDVTQQKDVQLEAARALLIDVTQQKDEQLEAARALLIDVTQQKDQELEAAQGLLAERDSQLKIISQKLEDSEQVAQRLLNSSSWRLTRPIRGIRRWLRL